MGRRRKGRKKGAVQGSPQETTQSIDSTVTGAVPGPIDDDAPTMVRMPEPAPEAPVPGHISEPPPPISAGSLVDALVSASDGAVPAWGRQDSMAGIDLEKLRPPRPATSPDKTNPLTFVPHLVSDPAERARIAADVEARGGTILRSPAEEVAAAQEARTTEHKAVAAAAEPITTEHKPVAALYAPAFASAPIMGPKRTMPLPAPQAFHVPTIEPATPILPDFDDEPDTAEVVVPGEALGGERPTRVTDISEVVAAHEKKVVQETAEPADTEATVVKPAPVAEPAKPAVETSKHDVHRTIQLGGAVPPVMTPPSEQKGEAPNKEYLGPGHIATLAASMSPAATPAPAEEPTRIYRPKRERMPTAQLPYAPTALPPPPEATIETKAPAYEAKPAAPEPALEESLPGMFDGDETFPEATTEYPDSEKALPPARPKLKLEEVVGRPALSPVPSTASKPIANEELVSDDIEPIPSVPADHQDELESSEEQSAEAGQAASTGFLYSLRRAFFSTPAEKAEEFARKVARQRKDAESYEQSAPKYGTAKKIAIGVGISVAVIGSAIGLYYLLSKPGEQSKQDTHRDAQVAIVADAHDAAYESHAQQLEDVVETVLALAPDNKDVHTPVLPTPVVGSSPDNDPDENPDVIQPTPDTNYPDTIPTPPSTEGCKLRVNMRFDSAEYTDTNAVQDIAKYVGEMVEAGKTKIYVTGFASIETKTERVNDDAPYNLMLGIERAEQVKKDVLRAAKRLGANLEVIAGTYGETEAFGSGVSPEDRTVVIATEPIADPEQSTETADELRHAAGEMYGCDAALVEATAGNDLPQEDSKLAETAAPTSTQTTQTTLASNSPTQYPAKVILSPDLQAEIDAYNAAQSSDGNHENDGNVSPAPLLHYNDIQRTAISELYARHTFGKDITWQQVLSQAAMYGIEGLTVELAKEAYFEQRTAQEDETALVVLPRPSAQQQPQEARVDVHWTAECYDARDKETIRDLYTRFYGQEVSPEEFQEAAKAYGLEGLTLDVAKHVFDERNSEDGKIDLRQGQELPIDGLYFDAAPQAEKQRPDEDAYRMVYDLNEQGYEFEDIQRIVRLRGLELTRDNFDYMRSIGKIDALADGEPEMSPVEQALAEVMPAYIPAYTPVAAPAEPPVIKIRHVVIGEQAYNPQPVTITKHIMLNEPQPEYASTPVPNRWREIDEGWDDVAAEMDRPEPVAAVNRSRLDDIDAGWDDILAEMDEPEQKYTPEIRYAA